MLIRRALFGLLPLLAMILAAHSCRLSVNAEDEGEIPSSDEGPTASSERAQADASGKQEETVEIPLDQIWAYAMPGTRDIRSLQADRLPPRSDGKLVAEIRRSLSRLLPDGKEAKAGFAVVGAGLEALRQAHKVLVDKEEAAGVLSSYNTISLVFFANQSNFYVHIQEVERKHKQIEIHYRFVQHETMEVTEHVALIPLGKLPSGQYHVEMIQAPMAQESFHLQSLSDKVASRIICRPFSFSVRLQGE
jgi:hypothetical protein